MISKGEFTYKVGGEDVKVEDFYKQLLETNGDVHINELEMNLVPKNTPFFMDEVIDSPECNEYWRTDSTVGAIYEKLQNISYNDVISQLSDEQNSNLGGKKESQTFENKILSEGQGITPIQTQAQKEKIQEPAGKKESQTVEKAPIFTYCKQMKNAIEALSLRSLYGHLKYEKGDDWNNFSRVENGDLEYSNAEFRHALGIGEENEEKHLIAAAWNSVARLEIYLRNKTN